MLRSPPVTSGLCCRSHVKLFPHHPSCLWTVDYQMILATCSDPGFWRSASGLARTHRFVSQSILSVVCSSVTPSPAAAMALKPGSFSPLTPRLKLTSLLSSTSPAENLLNLDKTERLFFTERTFHHKWQDFCQVCRNTQHYNPLWSQTEVTALHCRLELEKIYLASAQFRRFFRSEHFLQFNSHKLFPNVSCILMQRLFGQWKVTVWSQRTMESCCFHPNKSINKKRGFTIISQFNTPGFNTVKRIS